MAFCACGQTITPDYEYDSKDVSDLLRQGDELLSLDKAEEALLVYNNALSENPKSYEARLGAIRANIALEQYSQAVRGIVFAARVDSSSHEPYELLLDLAMQSEDYGYYRTAFSLANEYEQSWFLEERLAQAPSADLPEGNYNKEQYISLTAPAGAEIFYTLNGGMPEAVYENAKPYTGAIRIGRGSHTLTAYCVLDGVPSAPMSVTYQLDYPPVEIAFADPIMEKLVRNTLGKPVGAVTDTDCEKVTTLQSYDLERGLDWEEAQKLKIHSLEDLKWFPNLQYMYFYNQAEIQDFDLLRDLAPQLSYLTLSNCELKDISFVANMSNLQSLDVSNNNITDIRPLIENDMITDIDLSDNPINDVSALWEKKNLIGIGLGTDQIDDLSILLEFQELTDLRISGDWNEEPKGYDFSVLAQLEKIEYLYLYRCGVEDISFVENMKQLYDLNIPYSDISDLSPLYGLTNLSRLYVYNCDDLSQNEIAKFQAYVPGCTISY